MTVIARPMHKRWLPEKERFQKTRELKRLIASGMTPFSVSTEVTHSSPVHINGLDGYTLMIDGRQGGTPVLLKNYALSDGETSLAVSIALTGNQRPATFDRLVMSLARSLTVAAANER
jgi:hypothetical protein